ncbi:MAG: AMP-binding protein [Bacteroidia bacterium]
MLYLLPELPAAAQAFLAEWEDVNRNEFEFRTSGTTGPARICRLSRQQILHAAASSQSTLGWAPGQCIGLVLPATGMGGRMSLVRASVYGMHLIPLGLDLRSLGNQPLAANQKTLTSSEPTPFTRYLDHLSLVPSQALALLKGWHAQGIDPGERVGTLLLGGGPVVTDLLAELQKAPPKGKPWRVFMGFGMTETAGHFALRQLFPRPEPLYTPSPGLKISLESGPESAEQPHEPQTGSLVICGPVTNHQPLKTREQVRLDPHTGTFDWLGRADLVIQTGGHTLLIDELEAQIRLGAEEFPELSWLSSPFWYLAPLQDPVWGEQVALCLPQSLLDKLPSSPPLGPGTFAPCLPKAAYPRYLVVVPEAHFEVPGKILRLGSEALANFRPLALNEA